MKKQNKLYLKWISPRRQLQPVLRYALILCFAGVLLVAGCSRNVNAGPDSGSVSPDAGIYAGSPILGKWINTPDDLEGFPITEISFFEDGAVKMLIYYEKDKSDPLLHTAKDGVFSLSSANGKEIIEAPILYKRPGYWTITEENGGEILTITSHDTNKEAIDFTFTRIAG